MSIQKYEFLGKEYEGDSPLINFKLHLKNYYPLNHPLFAWREKIKIEYRKIINKKLDFYQLK